ncbi:MAG: TonB-dependent receptor domain-containing protein [Candidatus Jordarchaeum sp.]|uniref:TonB-dependent receptor domain-containing protein n=1 Tax=Candidatus Jordarchaeum sp. TaxID=2823881 RepID=UPI00404B8EDE
MKKIGLSIVILVTMLLSILNSLQSQRLTGAIKGEVQDMEGNPLPGATVTVESPQFLGKRSYVTSNGGLFFIPNLTPGEYIVAVEIPGFRPVKRTGIIVHADMVVSITIKTEMSEIKEEIVITAPSPVVDVESSRVGTRLESSKLERIPINRNLFSIVEMAAGVVGESDTSDTSSVMGSTVRSNVYAVDGVMINDPITFSRLTKVNLENIEEVEIITGAKPAEVGFASGGYVNIVSRTGGNKYTGSVFLQYTGENLRKNLIPDEQVLAVGGNPPTYDKHNVDISLNFGGPIIKDKLSFFLNLRRYEVLKTGGFVPFTDPLGKYHDVYDYLAQDRYGSLKLSWQVVPKLKITSLFDFTQEYKPIGVPPYYTRPKISTYRIDNDRGITFSNIIEWVINKDTFVEAKAGLSYRNTPYLLQKEAEDLPFYTDAATNYWFGSYTISQDYIRSRLNPSLNFTTFKEDFLGADHEIKAGFDYEHAYQRTDWWKKNPLLWYYYNGDPHRYVTTNPIMGYIAAYVTGQEQGSNVGKDDLWRIAFYLRDNLTVAKRLTFNLGVRYDESHAYKPEMVKKGVTAQLPLESPGLLNTLVPDLFSPDDLKVPAVKNLIVWKDFSPRIGLTYDLFGTKKTALKASFSRYVEYLTLTSINYLNPFGTKSVAFYWYDYNKNNKLDLPPIDSYTIVSKPVIEPDVAGWQKKVSKNLKAPYTNEYIVGIQHELAKDFSIGLAYVYKDAKRIVEDVDIVNPLDGDMWIPYTVREPGWDKEFGTADDKDITVYMLAKEKAGVPYKQLQNVPQAKRKYQGLEFTFNKRMSDNWQLGGSVVYSKLYGNYFGGGASPVGYMSYYDSPNDLVNKENSRLDFDRPLVIKMYGTFKLPWEFYISGYYSHYDGIPLARMLYVYFPTKYQGYTPYYVNASVHAERQGFHRYPGTDNLDLRVEKELNLEKIGLYGRLKASVDIFNVMGNTDDSVSYSPSGYLYADGSFAVLPTYGKVYGFYGTRSFLFNLRYSF